MAPRNVLVTAASRRVPLVRAFRRALQQLGGGTVVVTDVNPLSPAVYAADRAFRVPLATDPNYIPEILTICAAEDVGLVVPTIDDELLPFAAAAPTFAAADITVAVSGVQTIAICNDKHATCRTLIDKGVAAAESFLPADLPAAPRFPLFIKPRFGRGGVGAFTVRNARELAFFLDYVADPVIEAYLDGPEFTIDMLCDFEGRLLSLVPRERVLIRAGVSDRGRTVKDSRLMALGDACAAALPFVGPVNIQCRIVDGRPVVFEINPRFSGGIPLTIESGADFPRMLVDLARGIHVAPAIGTFRDDVWMTNYEESVFLSSAEVQLAPLGSARGTPLASARALRVDRVAGDAAVVLQARMGSQRLPGKTLATVAGRTVLEHCVERLRAVSGLPVVLATTTREEDDCVEEEGRRLGVAVVRGSDQDVLGRFLLVADTLKLTYIIRATADNPAVDMDAPQRVLTLLRERQADHVTEDGLPYGTAVEAMTTDALRRAAALTTDPADHEHVTLFLQRDSRFSAMRVQAPEPLNRASLRLTVDTAADLAFVRLVIEGAEAGRPRPVPLEGLIAAAERLMGTAALADNL